MMIVHIVTIKVVEEVAGGRCRRRGGRRRRGGTAGAAEPEVIKKGKTDKEGDAKDDEGRTDKK